MSTIATEIARATRLHVSPNPLAGSAESTARPGAVPQIEHHSYSVGGLAPWQARRVQAYIQEHLNQRIRATELAELVRLSTSHFSRTFRETFRLPPAAYIAHSRMRRAQELMLSSDETLACIAVECGMADQSHFTRTFRRVSGMSPGLWRRLHSEGP